MFRARARFYAPAAALLVVNVAGLVWIRQSLLAGQIHKIRVLAALPNRDVDTTDRFVLLFDEPVAAQNHIAQPLACPPFTIEPQPPGQWMWTKPARLEYLLEQPLPAGNTFRIRPAANFELQTGRKLIGDSEFEFRTRALHLESCEFTATGRDVARITFAFNQSVNPQDLGKHLAINGLRVNKDSPQAPSITPAGSDPQRSGAPSWLTKKPDSRLVLEVRRPTENRDINVEIDAALCGSEGHLPLGEVFKKRYTFDRTFKLDSVRVYPRTFAEASVDLDFSHYLDHDQPTPQVHVEPPVENMWVSVNWDEVTLHGAFEPGRRYTATVPANLLACNHTTLGEPQSISFEMPDRRPGLRFSVERGVLNPHGNLTMDLEALNIPGVNLSVSRVTANNIVAHLRGEHAEATSREVVDRTLPFNLTRNQSATMALDLGDLLGNPLGVYRIAARSTENFWTNDDAVVSVTDLAITAKTEREGMWVWITSLSTGKPVEGATILAMSYNNQVLGESITGPDGTARMRVPDGPDGPVWVVLARLGDDLAYLQPDRRSWLLDDVDQSGREVPATYDVMLYTERGAYRPGDTVHLTGIVRDAAGWVPPAFPLALTIRRPDGRKVETLTLTTADNQQGMFQADFTTDESARLGPYAFEASIPGSNTILGEASALVEAFLPVRFEVDVQQPSARYGPGQTPELAVSAQYLFGKPAGRLPIALAGYYRATTFESNRFPEFTFSGPSETGDKAATEAKAVLDETGVATIVPDIPKDVEAGGLWRANWCLTVTEPGARSVSRTQTAVIDSVDRHLGLRSPPGRVVPVGLPLEIEWIQLTGTDELADPRPVTFALHRVERDWVMKEVDDRRIWESRERLTPVSEEKFPAGLGAAARGSFRVTCPTDGHYRVTATDESLPQPTSIDVYATADSSEATLLALDRPERLELVLDRDRYVPGSSASLLVRSPFPGTLMLAIESDQVVSHQVIELVGNTATIELPIPERLRGGAYVTGTLVRTD